MPPHVPVATGGPAYHQRGEAAEAAEDSAVSAHLAAAAQTTAAGSTTAAAHQTDPFPLASHVAVHGIAEFLQQKYSRYAGDTYPATKMQGLTLPIYGVVCHREHGDPQVKVRMFRPNDRLNMPHPTYAEQTGLWFEPRFLRRLTAAEVRAAPWAPAEHAHARRTADMTRRLAAASPLPWPPKLGDPCYIKPGRGAMLVPALRSKATPWGEAKRRAAADAAESMVLVVSAEPGTANPFGIFEAGMINPTAAYIGGASFAGRSEWWTSSRKGYQQLRGQHLAVMRWDTDTVASPPEDLRAVHVTTKDGRLHGWVFLIFLVTKK